LAEVQLRWFESLGKEGSPDRPSNLEKAPELFRLSLLYEDLASDEPIFQKEKTGYPSSIAKDVQFLSQLSQSGQITLKKSRSLKPARGMQSWVIYIERNRKTFNKRVWSHPAFEKKARVLLAGFCSDSLGELSEIESKDDVVNSLGPAWTGVRSLLEEKLESCRAGGRT
jgi:hypothetical protein